MRTQEYELNPNAKVYVGMKEIDPTKSYTLCAITYKDGGRKTATFQSLGLQQTTVEKIRCQTPIMVEYVAPSPTVLKGTAQCYNPQDESQWKLHQPQLPRLDKLYPGLDPLD